ncbi:hypothetical protein QFZ23_001960 [Arthrobacter globiformis]|uniref:hypothetical protein n=1 Tax=Arthrobacter globiformis TaxID=1665 RepID=UPI002785CD1F|nr:hypothetical protein [Arthrobacter globiformis]MDQ1058059.1 hypothetical protein [Arthrobacter globiformis]
MATCIECNAEFDVDDAREAVNTEYDGDIDYDETTEGELCGDCSISRFDSEINVGRAIDMMNGDEDYDDEKYL